jgi:hypothetical protein
MPDDRGGVCARSLHWLDDSGRISPPDPRIVQTQHDDAGDNLRCGRGDLRDDALSRYVTTP